MLRKKSRRQDPTTLIWEYLEGDITPKRAERLSSMLAERPSVRDQLIESAVLHGMLLEHFGSKASAPAGEIKSADAQPKRRKSHGSSAA